MLKGKGPPESQHTPEVTDVQTMVQFRAALTQRIVKGHFQLPLLPQIANQVLSLTNNDQTDASTLCRLIHRDQALAGHLFKIANSAAFGGRVAIVSLQQAIARLGFNRLREIAFAVCVKNRLFALPDYKAEMKQLWFHSVVSAAYAKEIARMRRQNQESSFLCGLLHSIGKSVALPAIAEVEKSLDVRLRRDDLFTLMDEFHVKLGALIARKWALPDPVKESILYYRDYCEASSFVQEVRITCLASHLATHTSAEKPFDEEKVRDHPVITDLNLYPEDVSALLEKREEILQITDSMGL